VSDGTRTRDRLDHNHSTEARAGLSRLGSLRLLCLNRPFIPWRVDAHEPAQKAAAFPACVLHGALGQQFGPGQADADLGIDHGERPLVEGTFEISVDLGCAKVHRCLAFFEGVGTPIKERSPERTLSRGQ